MNAAVLGYHKNTGNNENSSLVYLYSGQNGGAGIMVNGDVVRGSTFSQERYLSYRSMIIKISYKL